MKRGTVNALEALCGLLDRIPHVYRGDGRWRIGPSCWGCYPLRLSHLAVRLDERWETGVWQ